jgi:hypothetical protein
MKTRAVMNIIQEWSLFDGNLSPEFTWEDVVEGRTIAADGSRQ